MMVEADDDTLLRQLDRLVAVARRIEGSDRRVILALQGDLNTLRAVLHQRRDALAQKLNIAGARSRAATAYSRIASLGRHAVATTKSITE